MKVISITASPDIKSGGTNLFGLGDDNKVYCWNAIIGGWTKNWNENQPVIVNTEARAQRRAAASKAKKHG